MYAIIATGGKQVKVQEKDIVAVERISGEVGAIIDFTTVLAKGEGADLQVGSPAIEGAVVKAKIVEHLRGPKLIAFKMKRRKGYRKRKGHRQELTRVEIQSIA